MGYALEKPLTIDDIYALPDGKRAELIDGDIYMMAPPKRIHQRILSKLHQTIANYIDSKGGSCEVYPAPFAVFLNNDEYTYLEPDISVICDPGKLDEDGCHGAPDWIIEIVSPSNASYDYIEKLYQYKSSGVREYWIVDPGTKRITVYFFESEVFAQRYSFRDIVPVGIYGDFSIDFSKFISE